jgi:hypothetical protein
MKRGRPTEAAFTMKGAQGARAGHADHPRNTEISDLYVRPLQVWRYLRQFPSPCSPNWSLLRQADLNSLQTSLRAGRWQASRYLRQFPSPCSPSLSLFSQARRNSSHCPPTRTPRGPISIDWEKAEIGITKRAAAAAAPSANFRIPFNIPHPPAAGELPVRIHHAGSGISFRPKCTKVNLRNSAGTAGPSHVTNFSRALYSRGLARSLGGSSLRTQGGTTH